MTGFTTIRLRKSLLRLANAFAKDKSVEADTRASQVVCSVKLASRPDGFDGVDRAYLVVLYEASHRDSYAAFMVVI